MKECPYVPVGNFRVYRFVEVEFRQKLELVGEIIKVMK